MAGLRRRSASVAVSAALVLGVIAAPSPAHAAPPPFDASPTQPFDSDVVDQYHKLARRAEPLAARRTIGPEATSCLPQEGITRKDAGDGTPYMFVTRSGLDPGAFCITDDYPGSIYVIRMGSRPKTGERMRSNLHPWNGSLLEDRPHVAAREDDVVKVITLDGTNGLPAYRHPGGMQAIGDLLVVGTENPFGNTASGPAVLFFNVSDPGNPAYAGALHIAPPGDERGSDPVGLTVVKDGAGKLRYLLVTAGGPANREVRFYRSPPLGQTGAMNPANWAPAGTYSNVTLSLCLGAQIIEINGQQILVGPQWPIGTGLFNTGQHQMINLVREGSLDGQLYMFGGRRDGAIVNPAADEYLDLYKVNLTADGVPDTCPISTIPNGTRQMGESSWGEADTTGTFSAASGMYVSPAGELLLYEAPHENGPTILFGEFRNLNIVDNDSPTLHPSAHVDLPVAVDEGSLVRMTGHGEQATTKAWISLFQEEGAGESLTDPVWFQIDYDDWAELGSENLKDSIRYLPDGNGGNFVSHLIWEKASSWRWFAPPGCTIAVTDFPIISNSWPGPGTIILPGTGNVERVTDLHSIPTWLPSGETWPNSPVPSGVTPTIVNRDNDIEGVSFSKPVLVGGTVFKQNGCANYYNATIGLGWDLDNNGTYDATGNAAFFSATQLDGPTTRTVTARAQHPTDTSDLGTGVPFSFPVTVRNVAPVIRSSSVVDSLGHDLTAAGTMTLVGLPVTVSVDFTDPGLADTQTATIDWGDGTTTTTGFDTFTDARNGATGRLRHSHVFAGAGDRTITATVTDDDGGATPVSFTVHVLSAKEALEALGDQLSAAIAAATDPLVAAALRGVRDDLVGNHGGQPPTNGAVDKLDANDPSGAIVKLQAAMQHLAAAESAGAGDLTAMKDLVGLIAESIATETYLKTKAAFQSPSAGQAKALAAIAALIAGGHQQLVAHQYVSACASFRQAVDKALGMKR